MMETEILNILKTQIGDTYNNFAWKVGKSPCGHDMNLFRLPPYDNNGKKLDLAYLAYEYGKKSMDDAKASLYGRISCSKAGSTGFYLDVDDDKGRINLMDQKGFCKGYWAIEEIRTALKEHYPATIYVDVDTRELNGKVQYQFNSFELVQTPLITSFLSEVMSCNAFFDINIRVPMPGHRGKRSCEGGWRLKQAKNKTSFLFNAQKIAV